MAYKSGFFSQFARKLRVFELLRGHREPMHLDTLAERFEVHPQTMRRDLRDLENAGETIELTKDEDDGRTMVRLLSRSYMDVPITRSEAHTFAGTRRLWEPFKGTTFHEDMENLWKKIMDRLPPADRKEVEADRERFFFIPDGGTKNFEGKREIIKTMQQACMRRRVVSYKYRTAHGKPRSGYMAPYSIGIHKNGIYVLGKLVRKTERRVKDPKRPPLEWARWPVERFEELEYLPDWKFEVPLDFRVDEHFDDWGIISETTRRTVTIDFSQAKAPYILERNWHRTQKVTPLPTGGVRLTLETSNLTEVQQWARSWGDDAMLFLANLAAPRQAQVPTGTCSALPHKLPH